MPAANGLICSFKTCLILRVLCAKLFTVKIDISFLFYFNTFQKNPYQGGGDGTFRGQRYFNCAPDSGVFVALDKLTPFVEIDERVVTFAGDAPVRGIVRYIGEDKDSHGQVHTIVGLELVSDIVNVVVTCRIHFDVLEKHSNIFSILSKLSLQFRLWYLNALRDIDVHVYKYSLEMTYTKE